MNSIACVSQGWGLGNQNQLLFRISADLKRFKELTTNGTVIMGRKTLDSLPKGKGLPNRRNIVLTRDAAFFREGVEVAHTPEEVRELVKNEPPERVWVIGGGEIYRIFLPDCDKCYLTQVMQEAAFDTCFPNLREDASWNLTDCGAIQHEGEMNFRYLVYQRQS